MEMSFRKNKYGYRQDRHYFTGIPNGVKFKVEKRISSIVKLTADGYGDLHKNYGNGALYVRFSALSPYRRKQIKEGLK